MLQNNTNHRVTITHWTVTDRAHHTYKFGRKTLAAHAFLFVHTGSHRNQGGHVSVDGDFGSARDPGVDVGPLPPGTAQTPAVGH